jgi:hypothetical protein
MSVSTEISNVGLTSETSPVKLSLVFLALLAYKIVYLLAISSAISIWPEDAHAEMFHSDNQVSTPDGHLTFDCHFASWDAEHYLDIASDGYAAGSSRCAFYPLFPMMIRYFSVVSGGSQLLAGMVLANAFSIAGWLLFFVLVRRRFRESVAMLSVLLLVAFPGSLFFQFVYTESLFFLLLLLLLLGLEQERFWLAMMAAFLLPLTRAVGLFCVFPLLWHALTNLRSDRWMKLREKIPWLTKNLVAPGAGSAGRTPSRGQSARRCGWLLLTPVCGWGAYLALMKLSTGNAFEGFAAQEQFGMESIGNLLKLPHFVYALLTPSSLSSTRGSLVDRISFMLLLYCFPLIWRLDKGWFLWSLFLGIVPAMSGMFVSYTRFAAVVFPLFVAMAVFLDRPGLHFRCLRLATVAAFVAVQVILVWRFVNFRWAG